MSSPLIYLRDLQKRPRVFTIWEKRKNSKPVHWAVECFAETLGVFFYTYFGVGSAAGFVVGNILKQPGLSSLFQIGLAYGFGIVFAIGICASTSGGHFNPCVTIAFTVFKGFPRLKALRYIVAQILGAYIASALVYNQYKVLIDASEAALMAAGQATFDATQFTSNGPPGIFALYLLPGQTFPRVFLNEFVNCTVLAIIIWATIDPTGYMIPPIVGPWVVAFAYAAAIWGFATPGAALNTARDLGARLWAMTVWGLPAAGGRYAAISALTNIPATLFGVLIYEFFLTDSDKVVTGAHLDFINTHANHRRLRRKAKTNSTGERRNSIHSLVDLGDRGSQPSTEEKPMYEHKDNASTSVQPSAV